MKSSMMRINVIGTSGSGKSTFSKKLSSMLQHPYIEIDRVFWKPDWKMSSDEEFFANLKSELEKPAWVLDGNYTRSIPIKWEKIDLVVWLDFSFSRTLFQAICRATSRSWTQAELWPGTGNHESFRKSFFSKDSIIWWTIKTHGKIRKNYEGCMSDPKFADIKFVRLRSHQEADEFLKTVEREMP